MAPQLQSKLEITTTEFAEPVLGPQNQALCSGVHSGMAPVTGLSFGVVRMPGGHHAKPHTHAHSEIAVFVRSGWVASLVGEDLVPLIHMPGSAIFIGAGIPHVGMNLYPASDNPHLQSFIGAEVFESRTDKAFNKDVVLRPDLEALAAERVAEVRADFQCGRYADTTTPSVHAVTWALT